MLYIYPFPKDNICWHRFTFLPLFQGHAFNRPQFMTFFVGFAISSVMHSLILHVQISIPHNQRPLPYDEAIWKNMYFVYASKWNLLLVFVQECNILLWISTSYNHPQ